MIKANNTCHLVHQHRPNIRWERGCLQRGNKELSKPCSNLLPLSNLLPQSKACHHHREQLRLSGWNNLSENSKICLQCLSAPKMRNRGNSRVPVITSRMQRAKSILQGYLREPNSKLLESAQFTCKCTIQRRTFFFFARVANLAFLEIKHGTCVKRVCRMPK